MFNEAKRKSIQMAWSSLTLERNFFSLFFPLKKSNIRKNARHGYGNNRDGDREAARDEEKREKKNKYISRFLRG